MMNGQTDGQVGQEDFGSGKIDGLGREDMSELPMESVLQMLVALEYKNPRLLG